MSHSKAKMHHFLLLFLALLATSTIKADELSFKIIGGSTVLIQEHPYQLSLELNGQHFCGGAIISEKYALTAGHCFPNLHGSGTVPGLKVRVGADDLRISTGETVPVAKFTKHPKSERVLYDITVLELESPLKFSSRVQPIKLSGEGDVLEPGAMAVVTGYGITRDPDYNDTLQMVEVPIIAREVCNKYYPGQVKEYMFCAGYKEGGKDSCQGDSGGPLEYKGKLYGLVSWGDECARAESPGVYSNITYFLPFVKEVTGLPL